MGFADDGALCFRVFDPETLVELAQPKINQAVEWGANNHLTFSVDKTTAVFFSRQKKFHSEVLPRIKKLTIKGVEIKPSSSMTYLGVVLDQKLNWSLHIEEKKCPKPKKFFTWSNLLLTIFGVLTLKGSINKSSYPDWHMVVWSGAILWQTVKFPNSSQWKG